MRRLFGAIGRALSGHRLLTFAVLTVAALALGSGVFVYGFTGTSDGTTAAGSHEWWPTDGSNVEGVFCSQCHDAISTELTDGPHVAASLSDCTFCHRVQGGEHIAAPAQCVDCHSSEAGEVAVDAHQGILDDLGETEATASWTCKSCHTHVAVTVTATPMGPLPLIMEPDTVP